MINPQKVRAMSRKTLFEQNEGRQVLKLKEYCEDSPVWKGLARSSLAGIVLYGIILMAVILAVPMEMQGLYKQMGDMWTILAAAGSMAAFAAVYSLISDTVFRKQYKRRKSTLSRYRSDVLRLEMMQHEQDKI